MPDQPTKIRVFELDALRGLALFMMFLHHFIFDLRYMFGLDVFAWQESWWFINLLRPLFLNVFLVVSGISSSFSRSNTRRGLRLLGVSVGITVVSIVLSRLSGSDVYVFFNVLHLLALGTLLYAGLDNARPGLKEPALQAILLFASIVIIYLGGLVTDLNQMFAGTYLTLPLGILPDTRPGMADYLPLLPWLGFFLVGTLIGRIVYPARTTAFPRAPENLLKATRPLEFLGRNSLVFYALHQPVLLGLLSALRALGWL